jgi:hypothetical protein
MTDIEWYNRLYSSYDVVFLNIEQQVARFENQKGWFEEATLTPKLAYWILTRRMEVKYE